MKGRKKEQNSSFNALKRDEKTFVNSICLPLFIRSPLLNNRISFARAGARFHPLFGGFYPPGRLKMEHFQAGGTREIARTPPCGVNMKMESRRERDRQTRQRNWKAERMCCGRKANEALPKPPEIFTKRLPFKSKSSCFAKNQENL